MQTTGIVNTKIWDIGPGNDNLYLKGIIVRIQEPRVIRLKRDNSEKCVWSFTLRDTPKDLINVTAWGSANFIKNFAAKWNIGDAVDVLNVKKVFRKFNNKDDIYQPPVTSSFSVVFNEGESDIRLATSNVGDLLPLKHIPTKPVDSFIIITDINSNGDKLMKQYVNVAAAIYSIADKKEIKTKDGRIMCCKDLTLIDETYETVTITLWNDDLIRLSEQWIQRNTILFLADVRVEFNKYREAIVLSTTGRTIITENPSNVKAESLKKFLCSEQFPASGKLHQIIHKYNDLSIINTVMSCTAVMSKCKTVKSSHEFTAVVYALLNNFNIDGPDNFIVTKCMHCQWKNDPSYEFCNNENCKLATGNAAPFFDQVYDIRLSLVDHTGSLLNCRLKNEVAINLIGCKASQFNALSNDEKTRIKWKYLLKYCAVKLVVLPLSGKDISIITIISLNSVTLSQYSSLAPMY